jgi:hypothetical protein
MCPPGRRFPRPPAAKLRQQKDDAIAIFVRDCRYRAGNRYDVNCGRDCNRSWCDHPHP